MIRRLGLAAALLLVLGFSGGCGRGLTVDLTATPEVASPGDEVEWTVSVRNDTQCATEEEPIPLPSPLPTQAGAVAFFIGAVPGATRAEAAELCREFQNASPGCADPSCLAPIFADALGAEAADRIMARIHSALQAAQDGSPQLPVAAGTCATEISDASGFLGVCAFDPLDPGETDTATYSAMVQGSGRSALIAFAFAPALGDDCRPGTEQDPGEWILAGCFPAVAPAVPAPALSPYATYAVAALLLGAGLLSLYRRRTA